MAVNIYVDCMIDGMCSRGLQLEVKWTTEIQDRLIDQIEVGEENPETIIGDRPRDHPTD